MIQFTYFGFGTEKTIAATSNHPNQLHAFAEVLRRYTAVVDPILKTKSPVVAEWPQHTFRMEINQILPRSVSFIFGQFQKDLVNRHGALLVASGGLLFGQAINEANFRETIERAYDACKDGTLEPGDLVLSSRPHVYLSNEYCLSCDDGLLLILRTDEVLQGVFSDRISTYRLKPRLQKELQALDRKFRLFTESHLPYGSRPAPKCKCMAQYIPALTLLVLLVLEVAILGIAIITRVPDGKKSY